MEELLARIDELERKVNTLSKLVKKIDQDLDIVVELNDLRYE